MKIVHWVGRNNANADAVMQPTAPDEELMKDKASIAAITSGVYDPPDISFLITQRPEQEDPALA